ncbi:MAG TPA: VCBS repeat-containing protein, partial [Kofleriaceae bacterium]
DAPGAVVRAIALADVDRDGRIDVIVLDAIATGNTIAVLRGQADGTLAAPIASPAALELPGADLGGTRLLALADVDLDGRLDAVVPGTRAAVIAILPGRGDGTFGPRVDYKTGPGPTSPMVADVDHDGLPDVVVMSSALEVLTATCPSGQ